MSANVNVPTNVKERDADVARKLQFYGIARAFRLGKVPSNEQIDIALNSFLKSKAIASPSKRLSPEGQALVADFRDVVKQAQHLLLSKNQGDLLQDFIWQSQMIDGGDVALPGAPVDKETAQLHGNQALEGLRTLGTLIISNGQFRKLLNDATILLRDMVGDAAQMAATRVNPSEEQLSQIDQPAADNTWHDVPNMSVSNIKGQIRSTYNKKSPVKSEDLKEAAEIANQQANPDGSRDLETTAQYIQTDQLHGTDSGVDVQGGVQAGVSTLKVRVNENISEEDKARARAHRERVKNYLSKKMPEERRERTIWRLRKMVVECQGHPDYLQAIETLLNLAETYTGHANTTAQKGTGAVKGAHTDSALKRAEDDLKTLIERFANGTSTKNLFDAINAIYIDADQDPELRKWFKNVDQYIRKCLKQQGYIMEDRASEEWNELYDRGNFLLRERYRNHTDRLIDEVKFLADQFNQDPMNKQFGLSLRKLFNDLGNDENGRPAFKPHLVKDLSDVIMPAVFENIRYVPIPRIEYSDPMIDAVVENLIIESDNLMPNIFELASDNYFRWGRKRIASKHLNSIMVSVSGVQMDLKDVAFYIKRKQGFPSISDQGIADIFLGGSGFSFKLKISTADSKDRQNFFKVDKVEVDVKNFNIKIKQSNHKLLFGLFKGVMLKLMRPALQKVVEKLIREKFEEFDTLAYEISQEADRAQQEVYENPEEAPNIYNRYVSAAQKKIMQGQKRAEQIASQTKVNVSYTNEDSIFPNIQLKAGISTKATEYKKLAEQGEEWRSPVFKLGDAPLSTDIENAPQITKKDHPVTKGGIREPQEVGNNVSTNDQSRTPVVQLNGNHINGHNNGLTNGNTANGQFGKQVDQAFGKTNLDSGRPELGPMNPLAAGNIQ